MPAFSFIYYSQPPPCVRFRPVPLAPAVPEPTCPPFGEQHIQFSPCGACARLAPLAAQHGRCGSGALVWPMPRLNLCREGGCGGRARACVCVAWRCVAWRCVAWISEIKKNIGIHLKVGPIHTYRVSAWVSVRSWLLCPRKSEKGDFVIFMMGKFVWGAGWHARGQGLSYAHGVTKVGGGVTKVGERSEPLKAAGRFLKIMPLATWPPGKKRRYVFHPAPTPHPI